MVALQEHPANTALLDLLAGRGPEHPPGTTCDRCGCPEDPASHLMPCSGCQVARYCSVVCQHAAWAAPAQAGVQAAEGRWSGGKSRALIECRADMHMCLHWLCR